jgi:hypothetical protein
VDWNLITAVNFGEELRKPGFANDLPFPLPFADLARLIAGPFRNNRESHELVYYRCA